MPVSDLTIWIVILILGVFTYLIRWSFLGVLGGRDLPEWVLRMLRYTPVAVLPALVAPLVVWPAATGGQPDPARMAAALATVIAGPVDPQCPRLDRGGAATLALMLYLLA